LRNEALETCRELQSELQDLTRYKQYLEKRANENAGMLCEERDRTSQLQCQLASAIEQERSTMKDLKSNTDCMLDKLYLIHGELEEARAKPDMSGVIQQMSSIVQDTNGSMVETLENIGSVKSLVEDLSQRYS
jgi:methyl-accepting chemotaxis protein